MRGTLHYKYIVAFIVLLAFIGITGKAGTVLSVRDNHNALAGSSLFKQANIGLKELDQIKEEWQTLQKEPIPTKEELAAHIKTLKTRVFDKQRIKDNVESVKKVIYRVRQDIEKNNVDFFAEKNLVDLWINIKMQEVVLSLLENGILPMAEQGKIDPLMVLRTKPQQVLEEEPKHPFVYATNSANPPTWGHVSAALMAMIESGSSKIVLYTGWSSGAGAKPGLALLDLRLESNDILAELFGDLMVHIKDLAYYDPTGKDNGKSISGSSPLKVFSLNETVETMVIAKGMDHVDDMQKIAKYANKHAFNPKKISFVFCPRRIEDKDNFVKFEEAGKDFKKVTYRPNLTMWASSTKVRKGLTQALIPACIREKWSITLKKISTKGRLAEGKNTLSITGASGDIGSQAALSLSAHASKTSFLVRQGSEEKLKQKGVVKEKDTVLTSSLFNVSKLYNAVTSSENFIHSAAVLDRKNSDISQEAEMLAVNGFATGLISSVINKFSKDTRFMYISSAMVYSVTDSAKVKEWLDKAYNEFLIFEEKNSLLDLVSQETDQQEKIFVFAENFLKSNPVPSGENLYALSKLLGEKFAMRIKDHCVGRLTNIYGPGYKGQRAVYRMIQARLKGGQTSLPNYNRDYLYVDDLNEAIVRLLDEPDISNFRVVDFAAGNTIEVNDIVSIIDDLTPLHYGKIKVDNVVLKHQNINQSDIVKHSTQKDIRGILPRPLKPFKEGIAETIKFVQIDDSIYDLKWKEQIYKFVFDGEECVGRLYGSSSGYLLLIRNKDDEVFVRKIAVSQGVHGNGTGKLESEINHSMYMQENEHLDALNKDYISITRFGKNDNAVWCDMPFIQPGDNVMKAVHKNFGLSEERFFELFEELLSNIVPNGYMYRSETLLKDKGEQQLDKLYLQRALTRVSDLFTDSFDFDFYHDSEPEIVREKFSAPYLKINGQQYENPINILERIVANDEMKNILRPRLNGFCVHGDLTFLNMLFDPREDKFKLIDSRGFVGQWDPLYDFGKMLFSLTGFFNIVNDTYLVEERRDLGFVVGMRGKLETERKCRKIAERYLSFLEKSPAFASIRENEPHWKERILFGAAIHYLSDIPFRLRTDNSAKAATACYLVGTVLLNKVADVMENDNSNALNSKGIASWSNSKMQTVLSDSLQTYFYENISLFDTTEDMVFDPDMMRIKGALVLDFKDKKPTGDVLSSVKFLLEKGCKIAVVSNERDFRENWLSQLGTELNGEDLKYLSNIVSFEDVSNVWPFLDFRHVLLIGDLSQRKYEQIVKDRECCAVNITSEIWEGFSDANIIHLPDSELNLGRMFEYLKQKVSETGISGLIRDGLYKKVETKGAFDKSVVKEILSSVPYGKKGTMIGIDGPTASGKSTTTDKLYNHLINDSKINPDDVAIVRFDWFLVERPARNKLMQKAQDGEMNISDYSMGAWDVLSYHEVLKKIKKVYESGKSQTITIKKPYNRVTGKKDGEDIVLKINPKSTVIVEGTDAVDSVTVDLFDATVHLDVKSDANLIERLVNRENSKPKEKRMDIDFLKKRFWTVDHPHSEYIRQKNRGFYNYIIDDTDFNNIVMHKMISDSSEQIVDCRMSFLEKLANKIGVVHEIDFESQSAVVKTKQNEYLSLRVGGKTAIDISKIVQDKDGVITSSKATALSDYINSEQLISKNIIFWGDSTAKGQDDAKVIEHSNTKDATLIGVSKLKSFEQQYANFDAVTLDDSADIVNADRTQKTLEILLRCYEKAEGDGVVKRRNALNAFFKSLGIDKECNTDYDVALAFDIDYTLICNSRIDPEQKETFDNERLRLAEILHKLWQEDFNIVFITANSDEVSLDRVIKPLVEKSKDREFKKSLHLYSNNSTVHFSVDSNGNVISDKEFSAKYSISMDSQKEIFSALGHVEEADDGEIVTSGLLGNYYDLFTDGSRRLKNQPAFPQKNGFLERYYTNFMFSLLNVSKQGNFLFLKPEIRFSSEGVVQIAVIGLPSKEFFSEDNLNKEKHRLVRRVSALLNRLNKKAHTPEAYETEKANLKQFFYLEIKLLKRLARRAYIRDLIGDTSRQKLLLKNKTLCPLIAILTESDVVLEELRKLSVESDDPLSHLISIMLESRDNKTVYNSVYQAA